MAEQQPPVQPPAGFQRPGVPGAGNLLDPAVRGELREKIQEAVHGTAPQAGGPPCAKDGQDQDAAEAKAPEAKASDDAPQQSTKPRSRIGPFPHGDVDLSGLVPNVAHGVRPRRGRNARRFYFLSANTPASDDASPPSPQPPAGPKPG